MGMQSNQIRDDMLSASNSRDAKSKAEFARLGSDGAWMPGVENKNQFIQVDFLAPRLLTGVTTEGKHATPAYVSSYKVKFSYDGTNWNTYQEKTGVDKVMFSLFLTCIIFFFAFYLFHKCL